MIAQEKWEARPPISSMAAGVAKFDYLERLGGELDRAMMSGAPRTVTELVRAGRGATPDIVLDWVSTAYGETHIPTRSLPEDSAPAPNPELHPLLFEWYFDTSSATRLAEIAHGDDEHVLCLGVPSVAASLCQSTRAGSITLVDANRDVLSRFPSLSNRVIFHEGELDSFLPDRAYSVVVADAPWQLADTLRWLKFAGSFVRPGGAVLMPIFPELTRPEAAFEREQIFAAAEGIGRVEILPGYLTYSTPLFERCAFTALGLPRVGDWRSADLLIVHSIRRRPMWRDLPGIHLGLDGWSQIHVGAQTVMLRHQATLFRNNAVFLPIHGCPKNTLTSVSRRDSRRMDIGIWTSRNRVAAVGDVEEARRLLFKLGGHADSRPESTSAYLFLRNLVLSDD